MTKPAQFGFFALLISFTCCLNAQISFVALKASTGEILLEEGSEFLLVPASTQKVVLAGLALSELGADYRFETVISYTGSIDAAGILNGDIIIQGGGDPTFASKYDRRSPADLMNDMALKIAEAGITCVEGSLVVDASIWGTDCVAPTWPWYDLGNYYAAGAWGLNYRDNAYELTFELSNTLTKGPELVFSKGPDITSFNNELVTGPKGSGDQAYIFGAPFQKQRFIRGSLPMGEGQFTIRGSLPEPPKYFALSLYNELNIRGIQIQNGHSVVYSKKATSQRLHKILSLKSSRLKDILRVMLLKSDNLYAEAIFRSLSNLPTYRGALHHYQNKVEKLGFVNSVLYDGCGLSPFNRISAKELANILKIILNEQPEFLGILPSVEETSWRPYFNKGTVKVKSGYMEGVRSYCGMVNEEIVFTAIYNGPDFGKAETKKKLAEFLLKAMNH